MHHFCLPYVSHAHWFQFDDPNNIWRKVQIMKFVIMYIYVTHRLKGQLHKNDFKNILSETQQLKIYLIFQSATDTAYFLK